MSQKYSRSIRISEGQFYVADCDNEMVRQNAVETPDSTPRTFRCANDTRRCYRRNQWCDYVIDCADMSDETNCTTSEYGLVE